MKRSSRFAASGGVKVDRFENSDVDAPSTVG
jgi:hypothetical protein